MSDFYNKYPYTDFHELNLDWIIERVKKLTEDWASTLEEWNSTEEQWQQLYDYVHDYFDNLDVQQEINNKIDAMITDGTFAAITTPIIDAKVATMIPAEVASQIGPTVASQIGPTVASQIGDTVSSQIGAAVVDPVNTWLTDHITQPTTPVVDTSLSISGAAADAEVTGDRFSDIYDERNLLFTATHIRDHYFDTSEHASASYDYFIIPITIGHTYYFTKTRILSTYDGSPAVIIQNADGGCSYTATYTGNLYWTVIKSEPVWIASETQNLHDVAPFNIGKGISVRMEDVRTGYMDIDARNLLNDAYVVHNKYYNSQEYNSTTYDYYIVPVTSGTTYIFYPGVRFLCKRGQASMLNSDVPVTYTADFTGDLYVTMWRSNVEHPDRKMCLPNQKNVVPIDAINWNYRANMFTKFNTASVLNVGDSIAETRTGAVNYATQFCNLVSATLSRDVAQSGSTLSLTSDQGTRGCIYSQVLDTVTNYPSADYDIILIDGGTNDWGQNRTVGTIVSTGGEYKAADYQATFDITTVAGATEEIFRLLRNTYAGATIIFVIPHKNSRTDAYYYQILDILRAICYKWSVTVVDMDKDGELNTRIPTMITDYTDAGGTHPNTLGVKTSY